MGKIKSGIRTSEFWLAVLGSALLIGNQHLGLNVPTESVMTIGGIVISFILGRSQVKKAAR